MKVFQILFIPVVLWLLFHLSCLGQQGYTSQFPSLQETILFPPLSEPMGSLMFKLLVLKIFKQ